MRCTILVTGTRGDVEPLVAVGVGLRRAGVQVRVATHQEFTPVIEQHGLESFPIAGRSSSFFAGPAGAAFRTRTSSPVAFKAFFDHYLSGSFARVLREFWEASRDADVVLSIMGGLPSLADRLHVPVFIAAPYPIMSLPTGVFGNPYNGSTGEVRSHLTTRRTWRANDAGMEAAEATVNAWRRDSLGLPPTSWREDLRRHRRVPHLMGWSPAVLPRPRDWKPWVHVTGYWFLDDTADPEPSPELRAFLEAGSPPVGVGFSSLVGRNAEPMTRSLVDALGQTGQRAVFITGLGGLKGVSLPDSIRAVEWVPYKWLLPRLGAMVHHGGAGSTAAALRAGLPQLGVPFGYDQALWAQQIHTLGVGPAPIPAETMTAERLAPALRELVSNPGFRERATAIGEQIRREDGIGAAVKIIIEAVDRHAAQVVVP